MFKLNYVPRMIVINALLLFICIALFSGIISSPTVDLASHYSLVRKIYNDFWINSGYVLNLGEMSNYPPVTHYFSAFFARIFGEVLIGINAVVVLSVFVFYSTLFYTILRSRTYAYIVIPLLCLIIIGARLPLVGQEAFGNNFLFPQLFSMAYFALVIFSYHNFFEHNVKTFSIYSLVTFAIALCIHPSMAVVYFTYCILFDFIYGSKLVKEKVNFENYKKIILCALLGLILFKTHYYTQFSQAIKNHNGSLGFAGLRIGPLELNLNAYILIVIGIIFSTYFIYKQFKRHSIDKKFDIRDAFSLIVLSYTVIILLQLILFNLELVSAYVIKKNFFGLFTFLMIVFFMSFKRMYSFATLNKLINYFGCYSAPVFASIVCIIFFSRGTEDFNIYKPYIDSTRKITMDSRYGDCYRNTITQFSIPMPINWLLSTGELEVYKWGPLSHNIVHALPRELPERSCVLTDENYVNGTVIINDEKFRLYRASDYNSPRLVDFNANLLDGNVKTIDSKRILNTGFSEFNGTGFWSVGKESKISFKIDHTDPNYTKYKLKMGLRAFMFGNKEASNVSLLVNSNFIASFSINSNNYEQYEFYIDKNLIDDHGHIDIIFNSIDPISPSSLGINDDSRLINFGINSFVVEGVLK